MYFGIYPWDGFKDKKYMDKLLLPGINKPKYTRNRNEFTEEELKGLGIYEYIQ
jgi:hypothetical protein